MNIVKSIKREGKRCVIELQVSVNSEDLTCGKHIVVNLDLCGDVADDNEPPESGTNYVSMFENYAEGYDKKDARMVRACMKKFKTYSLGNDRIRHTLKKEECEGFRDYLYDTLNGNTPANYFKKFKLFLDALVEKGAMEFNPAREIKLSHSDFKEKKTLTEAELRRLEAAHCKDEGVKQAFLFACFSGLRWCDVCQLTADDINIEERSMTILQKKVAGHSSRAYLRTYLNDSAVAIIESSKRKNRVFNLPSYYSAYKAIKQWVSAAGIKKHITFHCARHTFISRLVASGVDIKTIAELAGHSTTKHTERYVHSQASHLLEALQRINI